MAKAKKEEPKALPTLFTTKGAAVLIQGDDEREVGGYSSEAEAGRLCDLLNGAYVLFKRGEKSQGVDKPTLVGKPKKK